jgi:hypothetical protein
MIPHLERRLKAALEPVPSTTAPAKTRLSDSPAVEELEAMVRRMPPGSVETFTAGVQPLLLNSCATGGCHGSGSGGRYRLLRGHAGRPPSRRATQRNLHATLQWIDRKQPEASPLLVEAMRAHGKAEEPALGNADAAKYRQIVQWVLTIAQSDRIPSKRDSSLKGATGVSPVRHGQDVRGTRPANMQCTFNQPVDSDSLWAKRMAQQAAAGSGATRAIAGRPSPTNASGGRPSGAPVQRGAPIKRFVPVDPFDPEIFNRRYHGDDETHPIGNGAAPTRKQSLTPARRAAS